MDTKLAPQTNPITLNPSNPHTSTNEVELIMHCHDRLFERVSVLDLETGGTLFTVESKGLASMSWRRLVKDSMGTPLFELRHHGWAMKNKWSVTSPEGKEVCVLKHVKILSDDRSSLDLESEGGVRIEVRPKDKGAITTLVSCNGQQVAEIRNVEDNDVNKLEEKGLDRSVWRARVASGVDLSMVSDLFWILRGMLI